MPQYARGHQETTLGTLLYYVFLGIEFRMPDLETSTLRDSAISLDQFRNFKNFP